MGSQLLHCMVQMDQQGAACLGEANAQSCNHSCIFIGHEVIECMKS